MTKENPRKIDPFARPLNKEQVDGYLRLLAVDEEMTRLVWLGCDDGSLDAMTDEEQEEIALKVSGHRYRYLRSIGAIDDASIQNTEAMTHLSTAAYRWARSLKNFDK